MHYKTFYRLSLAVPILIPLIFNALPWASNSNMFANMLMSSLMFGGKQYLFFAAVMFYFIGRLNSVKSVRKLVWLFPPIYAIFAIVGIYILAWRVLTDGDFVKLALEIIGFYFMFGLLFGYIYCLIVEMVFQVFKTNGSISLEDKDTKINGSLNKKS